MGAGLQAKPPAAPGRQRGRGAAAAAAVETQTAVRKAAAESPAAPHRDPGAGERVPDSLQKAPRARCIAWDVQAMSVRARVTPDTHTLVHPSQR